MEETDKTYTVWGIGEGVHEAAGLKPMLTPDEQVTLLKTKGVTFERCNEKDAVKALTERDTFLHIASYRKLFQKHQDGEKAGQYVRLDFADLLDLDKLDCEVRRTFFMASSDIERVVKAELVTRISEDPSEDGYRIVADFMMAQTKRYRNSISKNLEARASSSENADTYTGELIEHYRSAMPVWVFLEVVPFGTLLAFLLFCSHRWCDKALIDKHYELTSVKAVRNCCAHQSCIVNGFTDDNRAAHAARYGVMEWLAKNEVGSTKARKAKMRNAEMQQLVTTLNVLATIGNQCSFSTRESLAQLSEHLSERVKDYGDQNAFVSFLSFLAKAIDSVTEI
ncbi:Abi family protein [uncultured Adlercreutzia sp.]|uniref:Abi family protein n=1 Tax=uncultured Adlercreutzia sp. TaxID=875803 RepID=UPI00258C8543|nr:Abi family protein [uncultured Adlercreutzia sp.]